MFEKTIGDISLDFALKLFGTLDANLETIESAFSVRVSGRDGEIRISGDNSSDVNMAASCISQLERISAMSESIDENSINYVISMVREERESELGAIYTDCICLINKGKPIKAKTVGQQKYVDAINANTVVFGVGPAGTGKTFLAVAMAVTALKKKQVARIVLTRPAVEAGEKLGFLPGDLQSKIDPYLRPLYDALGEMLGSESFRGCLEKGVIEICPLAYMRGRTLDDPARQQLKSHNHRRHHADRPAVHSQKRACRRAGASGRHKRHFGLPLHPQGHCAPSAGTAHYPGLRKARKRRAARRKARRVPQEDN